MDQRYGAHTLPNGLRVLSRHQEGAPLISCRLFIAAGSRHDDGCRGRAHLTEHCLARGAIMEGEPVEAALDAVGAELEAGTHRDYVHFSVSALPTDLNRALGALAAICTATRVSDELVRQEQSVILHEQEQYRDGLGGLWDALFEAMWEEHPMVPPAIGGPALFELGVADTRAHRAGLVVPERATLALVGHLPQREQLLDQVGRAFDRWMADPAGPVPGEEPPAPRPRPRWVRQPADLQSCYFLLGWPVGPAERRDDAALQLLARVLGEGNGCLLRRRLRRSGNEPHMIQADLLRLRDAGIFAVLGSCAPEQLDAVVGTVLDTVLSTAGHSPALTQSDLERGRVSYRASMARRYETAQMRAGRLAIQGLWGVRSTLREQLERVAALNLDRLVASADRLLVDRLPAAAVLGA